jgi:hypothetical protein
MSLTIAERAAALARYAHRGQVDKAGKPYWTHPARVAQRVAVRRPELVAAAWLHDVVEDTDVTLEEIESMFGPQVAQWVDALTHRPGEDRVDYLARVSHAGPGPVAIKRADIADNSNPDRLFLLDESTRERLTVKYRVSQALLGDHSTGYRGESCAYHGCDRGCCCDVQHDLRTRRTP